MFNDKDLETIRQVIGIIGENPDREGLRDTPRRVLKAYGELFSGYRANIAELLSTTFSEDIKYTNMVVVRDIPFVSHCEHHMLPFTGVCHIGYLPNDRVVGLSKLPRVVDAFSKRLQVQERMTDEIADAIQQHLEPLGIGVMVRASHTCMSMRGVQKQGASMLTVSLRGSFLQEAHKQEFYDIINAKV